MTDSFGARMRRERERRKIPLVSIAESTKISVSLLEALERGDVSRWPSGIFRKSFLRAYAEAIGVDADAVVREFLSLYPDPLDSEAAAPPQPPRRSVARPRSVKLTVTWGGSVYRAIRRLPDWKIVRMWRRA